MTGKLVLTCFDSNVLKSYLNMRHPEKSYIEDTVSNEASQVESKEVKVETYNTENKFINVFRLS